MKIKSIVVASHILMVGLVVTLILGTIGYVIDPSFNGPEYTTGKIVIALSAIAGLGSLLAGYISWLERRK